MVLKGVSCGAVQDLFVLALKCAGTCTGRDLGMQQEIQCMISGCLCHDSY